MATPPKKLEFVRYPERRKVEAANEFNFEGEYEHLFSFWAQEHTTALGTTIDYFFQDREGAILDPLYNEPEKRAWDGPYKLKAWVKWPEQVLEPREEGARFTWTANLWIPRLSLEEAEIERMPEEGDVVRVWKIPFFDELSMGVDRPDIPGAGYFFDILQTQEQGHALDNPNFTGFKFDMKRRSEFTPERRLTNQT